ncbi:ProQ/FINO family protein, partial [Salmonella enterica]
PGGLMATQEEKYQHQREARALLEGFWPEGFSFSAPKPLKIGITDDLVADAERRGLPFTREEIKAAVSLYAESYGYVLAMSTGLERFSLTGEAAGETTESDREWARVRLTWKRYRKARKEASEAEKNAKPPASQSGA